MLSFKDYKKAKSLSLDSSDNKKSNSSKDLNNKLSTNLVAGPLQQNKSKMSMSINDKNEPKHLENSKEKGKEKESDASSVTSSTSLSQQNTNIKLSKLYPFIGDTYRDLRRKGLRQDSYKIRLMDIINRYKNGCKSIYEDVLKSCEMSFKLAQNIVRTLDLFKDMCSTYTNMEEYQHRICELMSIYITCELKLSTEAPDQDQLLIGNRIIYLMREHLINEEDKLESRCSILRTLVYIPKLFNARVIMCAIFSEFLPLQQVLEVNVLPDQLYMLHIVAYHRWRMMQRDPDDKQLILNFAESYMKPSVTLCSNKLYNMYLPKYPTHSSATRFILNEMQFYKDIRNACIIDNAFKKMYNVVNLCDDEDDDVIMEDTSGDIDFGELLSKVQLEPLDETFTNIKLEEKTVVDTVDLTQESEPLDNSNTTIEERHEKWLKNFQQLAKQFRESQNLLQQRKTQNLEIQSVICLDSDSEDEDKNEEAQVSKSQEKPIEENNKKIADGGNGEDLFIDSYPLTTTLINNESDIESCDAEDADDITKLSPRFLPGTLRTYQAKKDKLSTTAKTTEIQNESPVGRDSWAYRRDSIHISSTPPEKVTNDEDDGTDVQDEHEDDDDDEDKEPYKFLPTPKKSQKEIVIKEIKPMGPYPTYNSLNTEKIGFSRANNQQPQQQRQHYYSDSSEAKTPKKSEQKKKRVHFNFNTSSLGPSSASSGQKQPVVKSSLKQHNYKASGAPDYSHLGGYDRFSWTPSIAGSTSTTASTSTSSSLKQHLEQEHIKAAKTLFRNLFEPHIDRVPYQAPFSPSSSSASSRSLTSPAAATTPSNKKSRFSSIKHRRATLAGRDIFDRQLPKNDEKNSIIRNREGVFDCKSLGPPGLPSSSRSMKDVPASTLRDSSDDYYDGVSDSDMIKASRYKDDVKLRKRCAVIISPTKEILQFERKRDEMYNEILKKQRRKLELRAIEKQREKERKRQEREDKLKWNDRATAGVEGGGAGDLTEYRNYNEMFMSSESEFESSNHTQLRARKQKTPQPQNFKGLQPLNIQIEMTEATTFLLNEIDAHLDKPEKNGRQKEDQATTTESQIEVVANVNKPCDIKEKNSSQMTKMRELNLLADIAQHLSPYQLELHEDNDEQISPPAPQSFTNQILTNKATLQNEKATVTEQLIIQSFDNLLEKQLEFNNHNNDTAERVAEECSDYEHESKTSSETEAAAKFQSSPQNLLEIEFQQKQNNTLNTTTTIEHSKDKSLEQILEQSINVLTSPPYTVIENSSNTKPKSSVEIIPLLISSVESLNHLETNIKETTGKEIDVEVRQKLPEIENIVINKTHSTKELQNAAILSSTLMDAADLSDISCETEISRNFKQTSLIPADISDISLESEFSKHLPDIAEPSPIVTTDMSDNSMTSDNSKSYKETSTDNSQLENEITNISLPVLPLVIPSITQSLETERNFNINTTLNTPTKIQLVPIMDTITATQHFNTPLKSNLDNELETPVKNSLEPETDTNVTKFLDLILNKTVTDAESETRDKILKELNAITADTAAITPEEDTARITLNTINEESKSNDSPTENTFRNEKSLDLVNEDIENKSEDSIATVIEKKSLVLKNKTLESPKKFLEFNNKTLDISAEAFDNIDENTSLDSIVNVQENKTFANCESSMNLTNKTAINKQSSVELEKMTTTDECLETSLHNADKAAGQQLLSVTELSPPNRLNVKELNQQLKTTEITKTMDSHLALSSIPLSVPFKMTSPLKPFNIKCRVRLKRLNISKQHCNKANKKETWIAIPITKSEEESETAAGVATALNADAAAGKNNEMSNCDKNEMMKTTTSLSSLIKKPCLKHNKHQTEEVLVNNTMKDVNDEIPENIILKKPKLIIATAEQNVLVTPPSQPSLFNTTTSSPSSNGKPKTKSYKKVTFDFSNIHEELNAGQLQKLKGHCVVKSSRSKKLPENTLRTLRAAETLQLFVNDINDSTRTPPPAEFNKKRSPIKNKCIAEDETPRPPLATMALMGEGGVGNGSLTPPCKKSCIEKSNSSSHITTSSKCKDQLVSSLATASMSDITTARIYTSSPLDQTLPEYDDNVDTVADSELILTTSTNMGSLRRKLKKPKKSLLTRPEPLNDDLTTDEISNLPTEECCNGDDDPDAVVDNEDDVFVGELLPIAAAANEHILEEIVNVRTPHIGASSTVIRDDYMNIEATATVPVNLFNDESRDLATPEPTIQSSNDSNIVDSSSFLNTSASCNNANSVAATTTTTTSCAITGSLEKSMLSPSEHEVSSTQETFFQTPTKNKQNGDATANKDKSSPLSLTVIQKQQQQEDNHPKTQDEKTLSSSTCLLQNNQVDTTNHSPEMCTLNMTSSTSSSTTSSSNRKIRKASTHDEILYNELQQQQQQQQIKPNQQHKRKTTATKTFCAESTSDNKKIKLTSFMSLENEIKNNGSLNKTEDKNKKLETLSGVKNNDINQVGAGNSGGGSSPSTTTTINEEKNSRSRRKQKKSSKSEKLKYNEKTELLTTNKSYTPPQTNNNPLIITIPKSRLLRPPPTPSPPPPPPPAPTPTTLSQPNNIALEKPTLAEHNIKEKDKGKEKSQRHQYLKRDKIAAAIAVAAQSQNAKKSKRTYSPANMVQKVFVPDDIKQCIEDSEMQETQEKFKTTSSTKSTKKKPNNSTNKSISNTNVIFIKDKYDLIKNKDKHLETLESKNENQSSPITATAAINKTKENPEKSLDLLKVKEKHNTHTKVSRHRSHKSSSSSTASKEKTKEKHITKEKITEKTAVVTPTTNVTKLTTATHSSSSNKTTKPTLNNSNSSSLTSPSYSLTSTTAASASSAALNNKPSKSTKTNSLTKHSSEPNYSSSSSSYSVKSKSSLSTFKQSSSLATVTSAESNLKPTTSSASSSATVVTTISNHHVRKKLRTK